MNRLLSEPRSIRSGVKLVSILSGKGGVGKSILAFNLGERLAADGFRVLIVDADTACGNLHILANADCNGSLADFINNRKPLSHLVEQISLNLDLLASPSSVLTEEIELPRPGVVELLIKLRSQAVNYDLILIDHPSGVSEQILQTAEQSDCNLLVIAPELTSIADGYGLFKRLRGGQEIGDCRFLINRAESTEEADHVAGKFLAMADRFLGRTPDFLGSLIESGLIRQSVGRQLPISAVNSQSIETESLNDIARRLSTGLGLRLNGRQAAIKPELNQTSATADTRG